MGARTGEGLGVVLRLGLALALTCAPAYADPPKDEKPKPTRRSDLSPLARALDDLLFGDPRGLYDHDRNPFQWYDQDPERIKQAWEELQAFRGDALVQLQTRGQEANQKFIADIHNAVIEQRRRESRTFNPMRAVGNSWVALLANGTDGNRPLSASEINVRAIAETQRQYPGAFFGEESLGLANPTAADLFGRNSFRIEIFESMPEKSVLKREDFEAWREGQLRKLVEQHHANLVRVIEGQYARGHHPFYWQQKGVRWQDWISLTPLTLEEFRRSVQPPQLKRVVRGERVDYEIEMGVPLKSPDGRVIVVRDNTPIPVVGSALIDEGNNGKLQLDHAMEGTYARMLAETNKQVREAIEILGAFQYQHYRRDRGKNFLIRWNKLVKETSDALVRIWNVPRAAARSESMKDMPPGFELAFWGRLAENPAHWHDLVGKGNSFWSLFSEPQRLRDLPATPPTPLKKRVAAAMENTWHAVRRYGPIPLVLATALGLGSYFDVLPSWRGAPPAASQPGTPPKPPSTMPNNMSEIGVAFNKPLASLGNHTLFTLSATKKDAKIPYRFAFGRPDRATIPISVPSTPAPGDHFGMGSALTHNGVAEIPTGDGTQLSSLRVTGTDGRVWVAGTDYTLRATPSGEVVIFPKTNDPYKVSSGWKPKEDKSGQEPIKAPELRELSHAKLAEIAAELEGRGFVKLPQLLRATLSASRDTDTPISIYDLQDLLARSALYSQLPEKKAALAELRSEIARAARFLNPEGTSCYECDGARELALALYRRLLPKDKFDLVARNVLTRPGDSMALATSGMHADFAIDDKANRQRFVMDTTPGTPDPRDNIPRPKDFAGAAPVERPPGGETKPELQVDPRPAQEEPHGGDLGKSPFKKAFDDLVRIWQDADNRRRPEPPRPAQDHAATAGGRAPRDPSVRTATVSEESPEVHATRTETAKEIPVSGHYEADPRATELRKRLDAARTAFANAEVFPKAGDRIPTTNLLRAGELVEKLLRNEISEEAFQKEGALLVPHDYKWPLGRLQTRVNDFLQAVAKRQLHLLGLHRQRWERGETKEYPQLLQPVVESQIRELTTWAAAQDWSPPSFIPDEPERKTATPCARVNRTAS